MSIETVLRFAQLGLSAPVLQAVDEIGYETPSAIQARGIPPMLEGRDLLGQAQTGTGKTAAFALPLLCRIDPMQRVPQALVLTPTRELAIQVAEAVHSYARHLGGVQVLPVYGGQHISAQLRPLKRGVQVVVGTPGRIIDHLDRGTLRLDALRTVVLDEADEMLRMGFIEDVDRILGETPRGRQVALFSATMPAEVRRIADRHLKDPVTVTIESATATVDSVRQRFLVVPWRQKLDVLTRILESIEYEAMLVFVRTKVATLEVSEKLEARGHASAPLNGDMTQVLRERTVQRLKDGSLDIVVATDVAARGLDVDRISHVVNYDIPQDTEAYVHRIGRTGRAGREGEAILLVQPRERRMLRSIERATGQPIEPMEPPSAADVTDLRVARFKQRVLDTVESEDLGFFRRVLGDLREEHELDADTVAAALAWMVQEERPLREVERAFDRPEQPDRGARPERGTRPERREGRDHADRRGERDTRDARDHGPREDRPRGRDTDEGRTLMPGMARYRLEVGRRQNVQPKHVVGAITNETGLEGRDIGRIEIHDDHCVVDLPEGMPPAMLEHLQWVEIFGHPLRARPLDGPSAGPGGGPAEARGAGPDRGDKKLRRKIGKRPGGSVVRRGGSPGTARSGPGTGYGGGRTGGRPGGRKGGRTGGPGGAGPRGPRGPRGGGGRGSGPGPRPGRRRG